MNGLTAAEGRKLRQRAGEVLYAEDFKRLLDRHALASVLACCFAVLTLAFPPACLLIVMGGAGDFPTGVFGRIIATLWPLVVIPGIGFLVCWRWRAQLNRKL